MSKKHIVELALNTVDVKAVSAEYIGDYLESQRSNKVFVSGLFKEVDLTSGHYSSKIPEIPSIDIVYSIDVAPGSTLEESAYTFNAMEVYTSKSGIFLNVNMESWEQLSKPVVNFIIDELSTKLWTSQDSLACDALVNATAVTVDASGSITLDYVLELKDSMIANSVCPDLLLINPKALKPLAKDTAFQNLFDSSATEDYNGQVGKVVGINVVASCNIPDTIGILLDSNKVGYNVVARPLEVNVFDRLEKDNKEIRLWYENVFYATSLSSGLLVNVI
jgi:hypothetical protein